MLLLPWTYGYGQSVLSTVAGGGPRELPALESNLSAPTAILASPSGELFIAAAGLDRVLKKDAAGRLTPIAGHGQSLCRFPFGDGGPAVHACLSAPSGLAMDALGNLLISDTRHNVIRRRDALTGLISTVAGTYAPGFTGDGGPATLARLNRPHGLALDQAGNLFIADRENHRVRRVSAATGAITTVAGNGTRTGSIDGPGGSPQDDLGDGNLATSASLASPFGVAIDAAGNLFIGDTGNFRVRRVDAASGVITTVAGTGVFGSGGDGMPATLATLAGPAHIALTPGGDLLIADTTDLVTVPIPDDGSNHRVRRVDAATGIIMPVAGGEELGFGGDGGPATSALMWHPFGVAVALDGDVFIADSSNNRVRRVSSATGLISTVAGNGEAVLAGDGHPARSASLRGPSGVRADAAGNILISDSYNSRVRRVDAVTGLITTVAGNGTPVTSGDGGPALNAGVACPNGLALDQAGDLFIVDFCAGRVRRVDASTGVITTVAGKGVGFGGDGGPATNALLNTPEGVALDVQGNMFIADVSNRRVRRVAAATGIITTVAGTGFRPGEIDGEGGDPRDDVGNGGPATLAAVAVDDVAVLPGGDLVISDSFGHRVRRVSMSTGTITTVAGNGSSVVSGDGGPATQAGLGRPNGIAVDAAGNFFFTCGDGSRVRRVDAVTGIITTVAGSEVEDYSPDGVLAVGSSLSAADRLAVSATGDLLICELQNERVRRVSLQPPGAGEVPDGSMAADEPLTVRREPNGDLTLAWGSSCVVSDNDYAVYEGVIGDFSSHAMITCSTGGATARTFTPALGNSYYLVVPRNALREGSYGTNSAGVERPQADAACAPREIATTCP
ncbi:MAG TPA: hypothetical protein VFG76_05455 [Candidatus Polarisedimenticolia bacterium]|nr:hypothetical protein [Candidatus Polarisedimenticolia bacterium]